MTRSEMVESLRNKVNEASTAGRMHRRDLNKCIKRLRRELRDYDRFQAEARRCG